MKEVFKDIEGYFGLYQVSNLGNVKALGNGGSNSKEKFLKPQKDKGGYLKVNLSKQGKVKTFKLHRLVAEAFIENPNNHKQVNHKDENPTNNCVENLEFCDAKYNCNYGTRTKRSTTNRSKQVLCLETGKIYASTHQVERQLGFAQGYISSACRGEYKQAYGFHWKYVS